MSPTRRRRTESGVLERLGRVRFLLTFFLVAVFLVPTTVIVIAYPILVQDVGDLGRELKQVRTTTQDAMLQSRGEVASTVDEARRTIEKVTRLQLHERTADLAARVETILRREPPGRRTAAHLGEIPALKILREASLPGDGQAVLVDLRRRTVVLHRLHEKGSRHVAASLPDLDKLLRNRGDELLPYLGPEPSQAAKPAADASGKAKAAPAAAPPPPPPAASDGGGRVVVSEVFKKDGDTRIWLASPVNGTPWVLAVDASLTSATNLLLADIPDALQRSQNTVQHSLGAIDGTVASFQKQHDRLQSFLSYGLLIGALLAFFVVAIALKVVDARVIQPIRAMTAVSERVRGGDYDSRVEVTGGELGDLARAVNAMLDRIVGLIESDEDKKRLQAQIVQLLEQVSRAADGDLAVRGDVTDDILGAVVDGLNLMLESIGKLIVQVRTAGLEVAEAAEKIRAAQERVDAGAVYQSERLDAAADHVGDVASSMRSVAEAAGSAADAARDANRAATRGGEAVNETVAGMHAIRRDLSAAAGRIAELGEKSLEINTIVEVIDDLAAQTDMLALNAAIEASRAGAQGEGFAVVAEEVRKLAERSSTAAREISGLIEGIQSGSGEARHAMEDVQEKVEERVRIADEASRALTDIRAVVHAATGLIEGIHSAAASEATGAGKLAENIEEIRRVASETAEQVRLTTGAVDELTAQSQSLTEAIKRFKVEVPVEERVTRTLVERRAEIEASLEKLEHLLESGAGDGEERDEIEAATAAARARIGELFDEALRRLGPDGEDGAASDDGADGSDGAVAWFGEPAADAAVDEADGEEADAAADDGADAAAEGVTAPADDADDVAVEAGGPSDETGEDVAADETAADAEKVG